MAVFRIEKTQNYTVMSNHHLRNKALSLKSKGLLSQMLSLPENWDYTLVGLSRINREKLDAIREAVRELERAGYITRSRLRDESGQLRGADYIIHELPQMTKKEPTQDKDPAPDMQKTMNDENKPFSPTLDFPTLVNPTLENPTLENPTQLNKEKESLSKDRLNTDTQNTDSVLFHSVTTAPAIYPSGDSLGRMGTEKKRTEAASMSAYEIYREIIHENIGYQSLIERCPFDRERIDEIVDLLLETICTAKKTLRIAGDEYPAALVKSKFLKLNSEHIEYVIDCLKKNTTDIRNIKKYLLAVLFNAPSTMDNYYTSLVAHNMANSRA